MPKILAKGIIKHDGKIYRPGEELTVTDEVFEALGNRAVLSEVGAPEIPLAQKTVKDLRKLAKAAGVEAYSTKDRGELVTALEALQVERVTTDVEPTSG